MAIAATSVTYTAVSGMPMIEPGDDLVAILIASLDAARIIPRDRDVFVVAQKIVSKAEGRYVDLRDVAPSPRAIELAAAVGKDPRVVEVILSESEQVVRYSRGVLITAHRLGFVMANAGVDQSNIGHADDSERVLLLPQNPDASCDALKQRIDARFDGPLTQQICAKPVNRADLRLFEPAQSSIQPLAFFRFIRGSCACVFKRLTQAEL